MFDIRNNLPLLYDFYIVAKENSYSKAGEKYFVSQANLSRNVKNLEEILHLKLVNTSNKGIELTFDGEKLFKVLDEIFNHLTESPFLSNDTQLGGKIIIGTTRNIADNRLLKYLLLFNKQYPNVKIKIVIDSATNLNSYLNNHSIDVLIDYLPQINSSEKYDFEIKAIGKFNTCFACSKMFYEKNGKNIASLFDLSKYNLIIPGSSRRRQMLDEILQVNNLELVPIIEMPDSKLMIDFVQETDSIGYFIEDEIINTDLIKLNFKEVLPTNPIGMIYSKNTISTVAKEFVKIVLDNI